ncbi:MULTISPECIES: hypothetical protein [unclassified Mesorhizobium]|uniref:hypothetical protein n=1 Tax=unclassified Mesorhizobium TaxID=325217 RepID=UPI000FC9B22E|nr:MULTISPECIES: hypothetical protein [unclassified Mesorhizobium]RUX97449.1 hypothetical protein EN993_03870 [Mesorhizobium sp. M7D.F.Ca.US.004.01.2.1]RVA36635.1 hypothetical protein EN935_01680 [Mesorhizobium sp. M7D.F.Ca.US.004.03.1.1]
MKRYVVVAKALRSIPDGQDSEGSPRWLRYFEELSYTFTGDQPISAIFARLDSDVVEIKLHDDGSNYPARPAEQYEPAF